ncbi:MAG: hypothetical protein CM15mP48_2940 [Candidatus Poseidoniales archaeon]|nr:MAG: hypothetical protein CM15mP48_2940 [Candidatus Poseidoniales archaeon]
MAPQKGGGFKQTEDSSLQGGCSGGAHGTGDASPRDDLPVDSSSRMPQRRVCAINAGTLPLGGGTLMRIGTGQPYPYSIQQ